MKLKDLAKAISCMRHRKIKLIISGEDILYEGSVSDAIDFGGDLHNTLQGYSHYQITKLEPNDGVLVVTIRPEVESVLLSIRDVIRQLPLDTASKIVIILSNEMPSHYFYEPDAVPESLYDYAVDCIDWEDDILFIDAHALYE